MAAMSMSSVALLMGVAAMGLAGPAPTGTAVAAPATTPASSRSPWIQAFVPRRGQWELGAFGGVTILGRRHDYYNPDTAPQVRLAKAAPQAGLRAAYFPLSLLGIEAEGWGVWTQVPARAQAPAFLYAMRAHAVLQLPLYRVVPFVLGGYGLTGVRSPLDVVGNDVDPAGHYGAGVKLMADDRFAVRLEGRHMMTPARARRLQVAHHFSIVLGLSVRLGPEPARRDAPAGSNGSVEQDTDGDRVRDQSDACPRLAGIFPHGCPMADFDGDGIGDAVDRCPAESGVGDGCSERAADPDGDGDGRPDHADRCPREAGVDPDGCIAPDFDRDGVADVTDQCVTERGPAPTGCPPVAPPGSSP